MVLHKKIRWTFTSILIFSYIYSVQTVSFDIATYLIGFYLLQLLIGYFTPRGVIDDIDEEEGEGLYHMQESMDSVFTAPSIYEEGYNALNFEHSADKPLLRSLSEIGIW